MRYNFIVKRSHKNKFYRYCFVLVCHPLFNIFITGLILANTWKLSSYEYWQSEEEQKRSDDIDIFFITIYTLEMIVKIAGLGFKDYVREKFNVFDACIVI